MADFDALDQGPGGKTDQDEIGFDIETVTDPASEKEGESETVPEKSAPKEAPASKEKDDEGRESGAATTTNSDNKNRRVSEKKQKVTQDEWQKTKELANEVPKLRSELALSKFEASNPIVLSEQYSQKWKDYCKLKEDPAHEYHNLSFESLKIQMLGREGVFEKNQEAEEEASERQVSQPQFKATKATALPGGVDQETYDWLKEKGYTDQQIADSGNTNLV